MGELRSQVGVTLFVVCDVRAYRDSLCAVLSQCPGLTVRGACRLDPDALPGIAAAAPDLVVLDAACVQSRELFAELRRLVPSAKLVVCGANETEPDILAYAELGCAGYVHRDATVDELAATVAGVAREELICSPRVAATLFRRIGSLATRAVRADQILTFRERQVLMLIRDGLSNKEIADRLGIAEATVKHHVHHLLDKLQVKRRTQAATAVAGLRRGAAVP